MGNRGWGPRFRQRHPAHHLPYPIPYLLAALCAACATPVAPSGGPADQTPPRLLESAPAADAVRVRTDRLVLTFSEAVDERALRQALALAPDFERPPEVTTRGRTAEVVFPDSLRPNTTYVVTLGTELKDLRGVALREPITLAFATGDRLDRGRIAGTVRDPATGEGVGGTGVFAYALADSVAALPDSLRAAALPDPREAAPDYRTQTGEDGAFRLDYLRDADFFVVAVEDRDRSRRADPGEAFAAPPRPAVRAADADSAGVPELALFRTRLDTIPPEPLRVRPRSRSRFAVRFTEPVRLDTLDAAVFAVEDSVSGRAVPVEAVYADADPQQLVLRTAPMAEAVHRLTVVRPDAVRDSSGNVLRAQPLSFTPPAEADTVRLRFLGFEPVRGDSAVTLRPGERAAVRFSEPPDPARLAVQDETGAALPFTTTTEDGTRLRIVPEAEGPFRLLVREPDSTFARRYQPFPADSLGGITGVALADSVADGSVLVEAVPIGGNPVTVEAAADGTFVLPRLPGGAVRLRAFVDRDGDGRWDGGRLAPYRPPEPLLLVPEPTRVRPRWETEVDTLRVE